MSAIHLKALPSAIKTWFLWGSIEPCTSILEQEVFMEKVRIAVIGVGNMGNFHLANIVNQPKVSLTAVCDIVPDRALVAGQKYNCQAYFSSEELLAARICDAVLIATPHYAHTTIGIAALQSGYHVLVEKPISVHKADCERLIAAHQDKKLVFAAMFNQRTDPHYQKIRELVQSGELGRLERISWIITDWFRSQAYYDSGGWRATWEGEGGGVLLNQCPHNLDLLQWICGMPKRISGFCGLGTWHNIEVEDQVTAFLEYEGNCTGVFIASTGEAPGTNRFELAGDLGKLVFENSALSFIKNEISSRQFCQEATQMFAKPGVSQISLPVESPGGQHGEILENFADAILTGAPLIAPAEDGIHSVELANAMLYSSLTNLPVDLPMEGAAYEHKLMDLIRDSRFKKTTTDVIAGDVDKSFNISSG
jgi:predicted dehydrogenase